MRETLTLWLKRLALAAAIATLLVAVALAFILGPYFQDDLALDQIVEAVVLDWRDFGRDKAVERLQHELDRQEIGMHVQDESCAFEEDETTRHVRCEWSTRIEIPGTGFTIPLNFESQASTAIGSNAAP